MTGAKIGLSWLYEVRFLNSFGEEFWWDFGEE